MNFAEDGDAVFNFNYFNKQLPTNPPRSNQCRLYSTQSPTATTSKKKLTLSFDKKISLYHETAKKIRSINWITDHY